MKNLINKSFSVKMSIIAGLILLLFIPLHLIKSLILERQANSEEANKEISSQWAKSQTIYSPILIIPVEVGNPDNTDEVSEKQLFITPSEMAIVGDILPKELKYGIYKTIVYQSQTKMTGIFDMRLIHSHEMKKILWEKASIQFGITDVNGIKDYVNVSIKDEEFKASTTGSLANFFEHSLSVIPKNIVQDDMEIPFQIDLVFRGCEEFYIAPSAESTDIKLSSSWPSPKFLLSKPTNREVTGEGFTADWRFLGYNTNHPRSWIGTRLPVNFSQAKCGVSLLDSVDHYRLVMRSIKYALLIISLTFLGFFLFETLFKKRIHPFQYSLVGMSLVLFYILLLSISEHLSFCYSYGISSLVILMMIAIYSLSVFKSWLQSILLFSILAVIYGYIYFLLNMDDYALLAGSIGLVVILGCTMFISRKINWYDSQNEGDEYY